MRRPFLRYIAYRLLQVIPTSFVIVLLAFLLMKAAPGDLADVMAGEASGATQQYLQELRHLYGLDVPSYMQFLHFLEQLAHFNLGYSFSNDMPVGQLLMQRIPATLLLCITSILFAGTAGVFLGTLSARYRGTIIDNTISVLSTVGFATPLFWVGLMLIVVFSVHLEWFPVAGLQTVGMDYTGWQQITDVGRHLVLPSSTLGLFYLSMYVRLTRSTVIEIEALDFIRTVRAKGLPESRIVFKHVLRNALLPILTITGLQIGALFGGAIVVETVFGWPGLGSLAYQAISLRDTNLFLGIFLCSSFLVVIANLLVDLAYVALDPRIELAK